MPSFSTASAERLMTCHHDLQRVFQEVAKHIDCTVICGWRSKEDQDLAYATGKSREQWPHSKHNSQPSRAVDVAPWPIDWNDQDRFAQFAVIVKEAAARLGIPIRWGGDFKHIHDADHFELAD